jgi:predicted house-cleaning NTP pyrophosphatase (Maf/HAM1 superfamily)
MSEAAYVVGCDQTLALGERRFSKPKDRAAAREQLMAMRGQDPSAAFGRRGMSKRSRNVRHVLSRD